MHFAEAVIAKLRRSTLPGWRRWLVVDGAATHPRKLNLSAGLLGQAVDLLSKDSYEWSRSASPMLLELSSNIFEEHEIKRLEQTLDEWRYANCFLYLEGKLPRRLLIEELHERTSALLPDGLAVLLRYYDPRILTELVNIMTVQQRRSFLSVADCWWIPDRRGHLRDLSVKDLTEDCCPFESPLVLDSAQERQLIDAGEADAMVDVLLNQRNSQLVRLMPADQYSAVSDALALARTFAISSIPDQAAFCSVFFEAGSSFVNQEPWRTALISVLQGQGGFLKQLEAFEEA